MPLKLLLRAVDFVKYLVWEGACQHVLIVQLIATIVLRAPLLDQLLHLCLLLSLVYCHLFDHRRGLFFELLLDIYIAFIGLGDLRVENLLKLVSVSLRHQMLIVVLMD